MAAIMLQSIASFYAKISEKSLFISSITYEKYIVCKDYRITHHNEMTCFLPAGKNHIVLLGNVQELLKTLDTFCFIYHHVDCVYTLSSIDSVEKLLQRVYKCLITCNEQWTLITETREWTECRALQKKDSWGKSTKNICLVPFKRQKQRRRVVQCLQKVLNKFEFELLKIVDGFLDGHGYFDSILVSFKTNCL